MPHLTPPDGTHVRKKIVVRPEGTTLFDRLGGRAGVNHLVKWFYAKVRYDPLLEPIFNAHIPVWSEHIETITEFWCRVTGGPSEYSGGMGRHFFLRLQPEHFAAWLAVWDENCRELLPEPEAEAMIALAHNIADDMQRMIARGKG